MTKEKSLKVLDNTNFIESIKDGVSLIDFWAPWCLPCNMQTPILESLKERIGDNVTIFKVNVDENPELADNYGIMSIPTLLLFKEGKLLKQLIGVHREEYLAEEIENVSKIGA